MDFYLTTSASTFPRIKITWMLCGGKVSADKLIRTHKTSQNISEIFCDVFTSEVLNADSSGQNECCFVFCLFY